jgi:hypothetical protein
VDRLWFAGAPAEAGVLGAETFRHAWGEAPARVPATDVFEGLEG